VQAPTAGSILIKLHQIMGFADFGRLKTSVSTQQTLCMSTHKARMLFRSVDDEMETQRGSVGVGAKIMPSLIKSENGTAQASLHTFFHAC
jgi:hypothetical protein